MMGGGGTLLRGRNRNCFCAPHTSVRIHIRVSKTGEKDLNTRITVSTSCSVNTEVSCRKRYVEWGGGGWSRGTVVVRSLNKCISQGELRWVVGLVMKERARELCPSLQPQVAAAADANVYNKIKAAERLGGGGGGLNSLFG